ncbi:FAD-dependent oxidoreductase [Micromonospora polyrhachis]|uniref:D-amino-acid oxidase n=1 Tax=Micromonospora polyrhachis TaxID=1282883 RepID=A0A7W7SP13_9ACTN|nr:FAD-dependent oxidoreductase [Micromonospora polyrhachis]MBB4958330.1 D-amino-acid oxidase [Micromonospora polyrhachis]
MATSGESDALVVGAGVAGLTAAIRLAEAGFSVRVRAERPPLETTSATAGASWGPYMVSDPRVLHWSEQTRLTLEKLAADASSGVRLVRGLEAAPYPMDPPQWALGVGDFELCRADELPPRYVSGWRYTIPLVEMPRYLAYLTRRLAALGVVVEIGAINSLREVAGSAGLLVNCTGLGSRFLVPDDEVYPTRGQLVVVDNPGVETFFQDNAENEDLTYFLPHGDHVVLGGCALRRSDSLEPDRASAIAIVERCAEVEPRFRNATIRKILVGLRPSRPRVRVERDSVSGVPVIHNYGHGGAGLTLSWGCADEVVTLVGR